MKSIFEGKRKVDPITLKEELESGFPTYRVKYSIMSDSFKLRTRDFSHTILYNIDKPSKLESISLRLRYKVLVYNLGLCLVVAVLWLGDKYMNADKIFNALSSDNLLFLSILFLGLYQYLLCHLHPGLRRALEREHIEVKQRIQYLLALASVF